MEAIFRSKILDLLDRVQKLVDTRTIFDGSDFMRLFPKIYIEYLEENKEHFSWKICQTIVFQTSFIACEMVLMFFQETLFL